jgi:pre-mRNA-splicing factor SYF1
MYADYEENFGLLTHAMEIYDKAAKEMSEAGLQDQCYEVVNL